MSDGISNGLPGYRDWQTLWADWDKERRAHWEWYGYYNELRDQHARLRRENARLRSRLARVLLICGDAERLRWGRGPGVWSGRAARGAKR